MQTLGNVVTQGPYNLEHNSAMIVYVNDEVNQDSSISSLHDLNVIHDLGIVVCHSINGHNSFNTILIMLCCKAH